MGDTFFLFSRPSFIEGIARILDLGSTLNEYNYSESEEEADARALASDWKAIGNDIKVAIDQLELQFPEEKEPQFDFK
ncbi:MAG: hypothetical protein HND39_01330 [Ignavibacteriota bacterium]|jgi:hypothetical protein|nr:hypothetical protein [Ignavibacteriales bacterium]MBL1122769.1 hypothetical protein [Ignavibacteriota bacterium]MBV6421574.1 hypothetical protein [Ignavibacteriaceae bacterium]MCE7857587.1 hypothetical protein [Ignavibacteria bacterium CHB3]MEB2297939.1 hypothetical protein [Ignavibacteria bacterium]